MKIKHSSKINLLNIGGSCSCIKIQIKKKKEITLATIKKKFNIEVIQKAIKKKSVRIEKKLIINDKKSNIDKEVKSKILNDHVNLTEKKEKIVTGMEW